MSDAAPCVVCDHTVVAWCPEDSCSQDDLVCYSCGTHANSEAAKRIAGLKERYEMQQRDNTRLVGSNAELRTTIERLTRERDEAKEQSSAP